MVCVCLRVSVRFSSVCECLSVCSKRGSCLPGLADQSKALGFMHEPSQGKLQYYRHCILQCSKFDDMLYRGIWV